MVSSQLLKRLAASSLVLGGLLLVLQIPPAFDVVHSWVGIFAGGRSNIKVILFFVYGAMLIVLAGFGWTSRKTTPAQLPKKILGLLAIIYGAGLVSLLAFYHYFHIRLTDFIVVFNHNELSSTMLFHNHIFKGTIGWVLEWFNLGQQANYDTGLAFVGLVPSAVFAAVALLWVFLLLLILVYFLSTINKVHIKSRFAYTFAYALVTFSLMKNIFDGGLFNRETPVALAGLLILFWPDSLRVRQITAGLLAVYVAIVWTFWRYGSLANGQIGSILWHFFVFLFLFLVLWYTTYYKHRGNKFWALLVIALVGSVISVYFDTMSAWTLRNTTIDAQDQAIIGLYEPVHDPRYSLLETVENMQIYSYQSAGDTVGNLLRQHNLLENIVPIIVPGKTCNPRGPRQMVSFDALVPTDTTLRMVDFQTVRITSLKLVDWNGNDWRRYHVVMTLAPCTPRPVNVIQEALRSSGAERFILFNPQFTSYDL